MKVIDKITYKIMIIIFVLGMTSGLMIGRIIYRSALIDCQVNSLKQLIK